MKKLIDGKCVQMCKISLKKMSLSNDVVILPGISNLELRFDGWCLSVPDHRLLMKIT